MTDLTAKIATMNRVLADATKECPRLPFDDHGWVTCIHDCDRGRVARFPEFRQPCGHGPLGSQVWEVCAGGLEGALAGLTKDGACSVLGRLNKLYFAPTKSGGQEAMPHALEILAKGLELVIEVAKLE